jgi:hypothetical protein
MFMKLRQQNNFWFQSNTTIYIYTHTYVCMCVLVYIYIYIHTHIYVCMYVCIYIYMCGVETRNSFVVFYISLVSVSYESGFFSKNLLKVCSYWALCVCKLLRYYLLRASCASLAVTCASLIVAKITLVIR